jgi:hypothetical protein
VLALGRFQESAAGDITPRQVLILVGVPLTKRVPAAKLWIMAAGLRLRSGSNGRVTVDGF